MSCLSPGSQPTRTSVILAGLETQGLGKGPFYEMRDSILPDRLCRRPGASRRADSIGGKTTAGTDSVRVVFTLADKSVTPKIHLAFANAKRETISVAAEDVTEPKVYVSYQQRADLAFQ